MAFNVMLGTVLPKSTSVKFTWTESNVATYVAAEPKVFTQGNAYELVEGDAGGYFIEQYVTNSAGDAWLTTCGVEQDANCGTTREVYVNTSGWSLEKRTVSFVNAGVETVGLQYENVAAETVGDVIRVGLQTAEARAKAYSDTEIDLVKFPPDVQRTANFTLALTEIGKVIRANSSNDITVTVPPNDTIPFPIGTEIAVVRWGTGEVDFAEGSGVTINSAEDFVDIAEQYNSAVLRKIDTNTWLLVGALKDGA